MNEIAVVAGLSDPTDTNRVYIADKFYIILKGRVNDRIFFMSNFQFSSNTSPERSTFPVTQYSALRGVEAMNEIMFDKQNLTLSMAVVCQTIRQTI